MDSPLLENSSDCMEKLESIGIKFLGSMEGISDVNDDIRWYITLPASKASLKGIEWSKLINNDRMLCANITYIMVDDDGCKKLCVNGDYCLDINLNLIEQGSFSFIVRSLNDKERYPDIFKIPSFVRKFGDVYGYILKKVSDSLYQRFGVLPMSNEIIDLYYKETERSTV